MDSSLLSQSFVNSSVVEANQSPRNYRHRTERENTLKVKLTQEELKMIHYNRMKQ